MVRVRINRPASHFILNLCFGSSFFQEHKPKVGFLKASQQVFLNLSGLGLAMLYVV
jgi:hypothetical protein